PAVDPPRTALSPLALPAALPTCQRGARVDHDQPDAARRIPAHARLLSRQRHRGLGDGDLVHAGDQPLAGLQKRVVAVPELAPPADRKSTRLNSSHEWISYAVSCL